MKTKCKGFARNKFYGRFVFSHYNEDVTIEYKGYLIDVIFNAGTPEEIHTLDPDERRNCITLGGLPVPRRRGKDVYLKRKNGLKEVLEELRVLREAPLYNGEDDNTNSY